MSGSFDPYRILQVHPEADVEIIQVAYRRLAQRHHPDLAPGPESVTRMAEINRAWEILGDPYRRAAHDRERAADVERAARDVAASTRRHEDAPPGSTTAPRPGSPPAERTVFGGGPRPPEEVSRNWTSGRSTTGGGYDPATMRTADGDASAGPPPGSPAGSVLNFGRYAGWSIGEIGRRDIDYLEWLDRAPIGRIYRDEIDSILRRSGRRRSAADSEPGRRGLFRRR